jgi:hypothetical protein
MGNHRLHNIGKKISKKQKIKAQIDALDECEERIVKHMERYLVLRNKSDHFDSKKVWRDTTWSRIINQQKEELKQQLKELHDGN